MTDEPLADLAAKLGRARQAHERRPDDGRLYTAMLEADAAYLRALVRARELEKAAETAKGGHLRRSLSRARADLERAELLLRQAAKPVPRKRKGTDGPNPTLFDAREG